MCVLRACARKHKRVKVVGNITESLRAIGQKTLVRSRLLVVLFCGPRALMERIAVQLFQRKFIRVGSSGVEQNPRLVLVVEEQIHVWQQGTKLPERLR